MAPIDEAIAEYKSREPGDNNTLKNIAERHSVDRSTLGRRYKGATSSRQDGYASQQLLSPQQEEGLVKYIGELTARGLPPTRAMIQNFASNILKKHVGKNWVSRFINRNHDHLISKWSAGMDVVRYQANAHRKYELYFELLHHKIVQYKVQPHNTYNMDEKGFMIGVTGRSKRVFSRLQWEQKRVRASLQDGSREWVTLVATVCADGSTLPPALIYSSANSTLQASWVDEIEAGNNDVFVSSSPTGWTNNDVGLAWLEQVFNRKTKQKARLQRDWRLLILDGHGSHLSMDFIEFCEAHRILLAVFPPHSTHTLQPLDVVCFKPLSSNYSTELSTHLFKTQGLLAVQKGDFFSLFWRAWQSTFTTDLVYKAFEATSICPMDANVILKRFSKRGNESEQLPSALLPTDWRRMERLVRSAVKDTTAEESKSLSQTLHQLQVQNEVLQHENNGLRETLTAKKKRKNASKPLDLQREEECHGGATFWSPSKFEKAREREAEKQHQEEQERLAKLNRKELQAAAKLLKEQEKEERRVARERAKEVRDRMKAEQVAARDARKAAQNTRQASTVTQRGKRKASKAPPAKRKPK